MSQGWQQQRERGAVAGIAILTWTLKHLGRRIARLMLWPITLYFFLTGARARRASRDYLRRVLGREPGWRERVMHFYCFASVTLDRALPPGEQERQLKVRFEGMEDMQRMIAGGRNCLMLVSHVGSFELLRVAGARMHQLRMKILLDREIGPTIIRWLERLDPEFAGSIIDASRRGPSLALALREALDAGYCVGMMGDRVRGDEPFTRVQCLGGEVRLPTSPWILASVLRVPVLVVFGLHRGGNRYDAYVEMVADSVVLPRKAREQAIQAYAQRYADQLEAAARRAPLNWFNFYDYWDAPP